MKSQSHRVLLISLRPLFIEEFSEYLKDTYEISRCSSAKEAIDLLRINSSFGVIIVDLTKPFEISSVELLEKIKLASLAEVVLCQYKAFSPDVVPDLVKLVLLGAYDIIQLDSFREEVQWMVDKAFQHYQLKIDVVAPFETSLPTRKQIFLDMLKERQGKGYALLAGEIKEIFPHSAPEDSSSIETLLNKVKKLPLEIQDTVVLVADDEKNCRDAAYTDLYPKGYSILEAGSGEEVMALLAAQHVDVLVLDIMLGDKLGHEMVAEIKTKYPEVVIIILTGLVDTELIMHTIKNGASDYVIKGSPQRLPQKVLHAVQNKFFKLALADYLSTHKETN